MPTDGRFQWLESHYIRETDEDKTWRELAACKEAENPNIFNHAVDHESITEALEAYQEAQTFCDSCPVANECLNFGTSNKETGIYAGVYLREGKVVNITPAYFHSLWYGEH